MRPREQEPGQTSGPWSDRRLLAAVGLAVVLRLGLFPFAENKQADAPIRALIAERMNAEPAAAADPRVFCQFGPLPIEVMRPFIALDADARRSSRLPSLLAGLAVFIPLGSLGRRMFGRGRVPALAALALAVSPLHLQASTTAASEALYLLFLVAALERLHAALGSGGGVGGGRPALLAAAALTSLAAVTRYDTWLAVPVAALAIFFCRGRDARAAADAALFVAVAAILPAGYLLWSWAASGDPFFFARYITRDHANLAGEVTARLGGGLARARQLGVWAVSFAFVMTPAALAAALAAAARAAPRWRSLLASHPASAAVLAVALAPTGAYLAKGLVFGDFEPLPRFALGPGVVLLPVAAAALVAAQARLRAPAFVSVLLLGGGGVLASAVALLLAHGGPGRIWTGPESIAPLTRLDADDRALARFLADARRPGEGVYLDTFGFNDIVIAHAARVPEPKAVTLGLTRDPIRTLAAARARTSASWFAVHDESWGRVPIPDWPPSGEARFGGWRLVRYPRTFERGGGR